MLAQEKSTHRQHLGQYLHHKSEDIHHDKHGLTRFFDKICFYDKCCDPINKYVFIIVKIKYVNSSRICNKINFITKLDTFYNTR